LRVLQLRLRRGQWWRVLRRLLDWLAMVAAGEQHKKWKHQMRQHSGEQKSLGTAGERG